MGGRRQGLKSPWGLPWEDELPQFIIRPQGGGAQKSPLVWLQAEADCQILKRDPHQEADIPPLPPQPIYSPQGGLVKEPSPKKGARSWSLPSDR